MRVPYSWLREYLQTDLDLEALCHLLTMGGLEVEEVREWVADDSGASDQILMTSVTPNRGDLLSMVGVARHAAALSAGGFTPPAPSFPETDNPLVDPVKASLGPLTVEIVDPAGCPRYSALLIEGIEVGPSPYWLRCRLEQAGIRSINNVVDATNYVVWELGQPLHAFDLKLVKDGHIIVRRAEQGEKLLLLDDSWPPLTAEDVVIADPMGSVALAGIMGGADTQMREITRAVLLESAHFDPVAIRRTSLRLGLSTEASYRFERHVDPNLTLPALARAAELILATAGGRIVQPALDVKTRDFSPLEVSLRPRRANAVLGTYIEPETMAEYLRRLGCEVVEGETMRVQVPTFRPDLQREIDLIEEVAIVYGYANIGFTVPGRLSQSGRLTREQRLRRRAGELLRECGLNENLSFSQFCPADLAQCLWPADGGGHDVVQLANPISSEMTALRTTLLPALLGAGARNARQRVVDVALYEIGTVFSAQPEAELPRERQHVAALMMGSPLAAHWDLAPEQAEVDFYYVRGIVEQLCEGLGLEQVSFARLEHASFHPGRCAQILLGEENAGLVGEVAGAVAMAYDLPGRAYAFELDLDLLVERANLPKAYRPVPRFPAADRDVAMVVPDTDEFLAGRLAAEIKQAGGQFLASVTPFDVYVAPERFGAGRKSIAFRLLFRAEDRTLTDEELDSAMAAIHQHLEDRVGAEVRK